MDNTSLDVLTVVADLLDYVSLLDFAMTCRKHKLASDPAKFRVVRLSFTTPESLERAVTKAVDVLGTAKSLQHVQHLELVTSRHSVEPMLDRCFNREIQSLDPWTAHQATDKISSKFRAVEQWRFLLVLLAKLPALKHLSWASIERIPVQLVCFVNDSRPDCRLHAYHFDLRVNHTTYDQPIELSQDAVEIAIAPCLHTLTYTGMLDPFGHVGYFDIIVDMAAGAAPNLRKVHLSSTPPPAVHPNTLLGLPQPWRWPRGRLPPKFRSGIGSLQAVDIDTPEFSLIRCSTFTNLTLLKTLTISDSLLSNDIGWLIADVSRLPNLEELTVKDPSSGHHKCRHSQPDALIAFITTLPRLSRVELGHQLDQSHLVKIIEFCAHRLRRLNADYCFIDLQFIRRLQRLCPFIEQISLAIHRWAGSMLETAIYRSLGEFRMLETLQLRVRSFQAASSDGNFDVLWSETCSPMDASFFDEPRMDQLYFAIRDLAFDQTLASSIFCLVSSTKPPYARPLERLQLWADPEMNDSATQHMFLMDLPSALRQVACSWLCVRDLSDLQPNRCFVKRTAFKGGSTNISYVVESDAQQIENVERLQQGPYGAVVRLAWPETTHKPFNEAWHSFPLHED